MKTVKVIKILLEIGKAIISVLIGYFGGNALLG